MCPVIGVSWCKAWVIHPVLKNMNFFVFRYSFCHTSHLHPFPFSATTQIILKHTRSTRFGPGRQLYFVCNDCWTYSRHVSVLSEPCWGCYILESEGWEFWTFGRGRSAWWRHSCWMFILVFFHQNLIGSLTMLWFFEDGQSLINFVSFFIRFNFFFALECCWILDHFDFDQDWDLAMIFRGWPIPHQLCIAVH